MGLTGGVAAGKSEALSAFGRLGAATISADQVVHDLLDQEPLLSRLKDRWGEGVAPEGRVDRTVVGVKVFNDPEELAWLEAQIHPLVGGELHSWLEDLNPDTEFAVAEIPLLFEGEMFRRFDHTVAIVAGEEVRQKRARARGHEGVEGRESRQLSQQEKAARADTVIANDGSPAELEAKLGQLLDELRPELATGGQG
ncbi:MAG: dephospho-CoA kinase [Solirubrobacterales bacterium]|nr:dephospho-CoA kinase [Solirubrobacterales bacterium]MCB0868189.1 dephospho-CoA kinase [Solirubrobacterales bacterium]